MENHPGLSHRGNSLATNPARIDQEIFMEAIQNLYCPDQNPDGAFPLNIAENQLSAPFIKDKLISIVRQNDIPEWVLSYTHMLGNPDVRTEIATFMENHLCKCPISPESIGLSAGAAAVIEVSSFVLANPNDVVVIPAPAYPMYTHDFGLKSRIKRHDLQTHFEIEEIQSIAPVTTTLLDSTWNKLKSEEKCFKILLITAPDNPTGCVYPENQLIQLAEWCIQHEVHMIVNEIYGLSIIQAEDRIHNDDVSYSSFAKVMHTLQSNYLHLWYAFSKDFAMSGLRVGVVHSLNESFLNGYANANVPHMVSNITQWMIGELLKDAEFVEQYISDNKVRITQSYQLIVDALREIDVPFIPSQGSFFVWADFSKYLNKQTPQGEEQLWLDIYQNTGVLFTPGLGFNHQKNGLFRIVFTAVPHAHLEVALNKLVHYLSERVV